MKKTICWTLLSLGLSACGLLSRHPGSGYTDEFGFYQTTGQEHFANKLDQAEQQARSELGIASERALDEIERNTVLLRLNVSRLERALETPKDRKQYYALKPFFRNDQERVEYLSLPTSEARDRYATAKNLDTAESQFAPEISKLVEEGDIGMGMTKKAVKESWGEPDFVDVAGDPLFGNERWKYVKYISNEDGYSRENRLVYFEAGRVSGWETAR